MKQWRLLRSNTSAGMTCSHAIAHPQRLAHRWLRRSMGDGEVR